MVFSHKYKDHELHLIQRENFLHIIQSPQRDFSLTQTKELKIHKYPTATPHIKQEAMLHPRQDCTIQTK